MLDIIGIEACEEWMGKRVRADLDAVVCKGAHAVPAEHWRTAEECRATQPLELAHDTVLEPWVELAYRDNDPLQGARVAAAAAHGRPDRRVRSDIGHCRPARRKQALVPDGPHRPLDAIPGRRDPAIDEVGCDEDGGRHAKSREYRLRDLQVVAVPVVERDGGPVFRERLRILEARHEHLHRYDARAAAEQQKLLLEEGG